MCLTLPCPAAHVCSASGVALAWVPGGGPHVRRSSDNASAPASETGSVASKGISRRPAASPPLSRGSTAAGSAQQRSHGPGGLPPVSALLASLDAGSEGSRRHTAADSGSVPAARVHETGACANADEGSGSEGGGGRQVPTRTTLAGWLGEASSAGQAAAAAAAAVAPSAAAHQHGNAAGGETEAATAASGSAPPSAAVAAAALHRLREQRLSQRLSSGGPPQARVQQQQGSTGGPTASSPQSSEHERGGVSSAAVARGGVEGQVQIAPLAVAGPELGVGAAGDLAVQVQVDAGGSVPDLVPLSVVEVMAAAPPPLEGEGSLRALREVMRQQGAARRTGASEGAPAAQPASSAVSANSAGSPEVVPVQSVVADRASWASATGTGCASGAESLSTFNAQQARPGSGANTATSRPRAAPSPQHPLMTLLGQASADLQILSSRLGVSPLVWGR